MADASPTPSDATEPDNSASESTKTAGKSKSTQAKKTPGTYTVHPALHKALRVSAMLISIENEGTDKEDITADDILQEALINHLDKLQKSGIHLPSKVLKDFEKLKTTK